MGWKTCDHYWGPEHGLRYPSGTRYGVLQVCVRCRARRTKFFENGAVRVSQPLPKKYRNLDDEEPKPAS